jgi:CBS-domain-containing membrane protein
MSRTPVDKSARPPLEAQRARDLMSGDPVSLPHDATVREAVALLVDRGFSAAPVVDRAGRPVGVVSRTDLLVHEREYVRHARLGEAADWDVYPRHAAHEGFSVEVMDPTRVEEIMTPTVFTVGLDTPAREVVKHMLDLKVHQLFVVDNHRALVGVITALDVLRHL